MQKVTYNLKLTNKRGPQITRNVSPTLRVDYVLIFSRNFAMSCNPGHVWIVFYTSEYTVPGCFFLLHTSDQVTSDEVCSNFIYLFFNDDDEDVDDSDAAMEVHVV